MKVSKWFGGAVALFFLFCALVPTYETAHGFACFPDNLGLPLTSSESTTVASAIDGIESYPESLAWQDADGNPHSESCSTIARQLRAELANGDIEAEVFSNDFDGWEYEGGININDSLLKAAGEDGDALGHLMEVLVHEWVHKQQEGIEEALRCWICSAKEVEATDAELAYKDSLGIPHSNPHYRFALGYWMTSLLNYQNGLLENYSVGRQICGGLVVEIHRGEDSDPDEALCYHSGETAARQYSLAPLRCTDFRVIENYFPDGNGLLLACGFVPGAGGRLQSFVLSDSGIVGPFITRDFGPSFFSIERAQFDDSYIVLDTATTQLYRLVDTDGNALPDQIAGVFVSAAQFPQLEGMLSVKTAIHPVFGTGLIVNPEPPRHFHVVHPYDQRWFLVDADGDHVADACLPVRRCEFMHVRPQIREVPYAGDHFATVFGTWQHDIAVYITDETGEILMEMLGVAHLMDSIKVACPLTRSLLAGEYIIPVDVQTGQRSGRPQPVRDLAPEHLVIQVGPGGGILFLHWDPVPGAVEYAIWMSEDGVNFYDSGMRTPTNEFAVPPMGNRHYFQVRAIR